MKKSIVPALIFAGIILAGCSHIPTTTNQQSQQQDQTQTSQQGSKFSFQNPKKSAHYESNTPEHGSTLAGVPINIVINVNFDLAKPSNITITKDGKDYAVGDTTIDANKLTLRRNMDPASPDGVYTVNYKACWPDGSCHDGSFQFAIDRSKAAGFVDLTHQGAPIDMAIDMKDIAFAPQNFKISKGTKVTWTNSDSVNHYVNTDSHPAHTYLLDMNSKALEAGDSYSYTFDTPGAYPYHCSAHAGTMTANILVI